MNRLALFAFVVGCASPSSAPKLVLGEPPSELYERGAAIASADGWLIEHDPILGTVREMRGAGVPVLFASAEADVRAFVAARRDLFGTDELVFAGSVVDDTLASFQYTQQYRGLPVIGAHLGLTVSHGKLVLVQGTTHRLDVDTTPRIALADALATVRTAHVTPRKGDRDDARLVVLPVRSPGAVRYHLAWEVTAWRGEDQAVVFVDAHHGHIVSAYDANRYDYAGVAKNNVDQRTVGDDVIALPAGHLRLRTARGATALTDANGAFAIRGGQGALFVSANLHGRYVQVLNLSGENAAFVGVMRPEKQYELEWTETRSTPEERDVFRGATDTNRFVATVYPDLPWLEHPLLAKVNHRRTCNAFWNGNSINFFQAGDGCNNTGRIFDVIAHEWGHGFDQHAPGGAIDGALGEFIGDLVSFVQTKSHLLGPGFLVGGGAVRDLENPAFDCFDPEIRQVHAAGQLLGNLVWDIMVDLERAGVTGEQLKRLLLRPVAIAQTRSEWYGAMLAVDDDDGNLANGTPNECLIYNQYKAHSCKGHRWPGMPAEDPAHCVR